MRTSLSIFSSEISVPTAAFFAIIILAAMEAFYLSTTIGFSGVPVFEPTVDDAVVLARQKAINGPVSGSDVIIVGDSSALRGFAPNVLEDGIDLSFYNLGTFVSFSLAGQLELAALAIEANDTVKTVVLSILPVSLSLTEEQVREYNLLGRYLVSNRSFLNVFSLSIDDHINWFTKKHRINRMPSHMGGSFEGLYTELLKSDGYLPKQSVAIDLDRKFGAVDISEFSWKTLESFMLMLSDSDVELVLTINPRPKNVVNSDYEQSVQNMLRMITNRFPEIIIDWDNPLLWEHRYFSDASHLNNIGAIRNSNNLRDRVFR